MIIAWWDRESPELIELIEDDILPWINANWVEKRPATPEELEMYKKGIHHYIIKKSKKPLTLPKKTDKIANVETNKGE